MSDTPRTDRCLKKAKTIGQEVDELTCLCRKLERKLIAVMAFIKENELIKCYEPNEQRCCDGRKK